MGFDQRKTGCNNLVGLGEDVTCNVSASEYTFFLLYFIVLIIHTLHQRTDFDDVYIIWQVYIIVPQWVSLILLRVSNPQKTSIWSVWQFGTRLSSGHAIGASLQKIRKSHSIPISTMIRLIKALAWPVAMYCCESGTLRKNEETHHDIFEMKGLRKILRVSWTSKKTNGSVLNKAEVVRHCQSKEASILWSPRGNKRVT